jgi:hypothetical protein
VDTHETVSEGVNLQDVVGAHEADVKVQAVHRKAHRLLADRIVEVVEGS